MISLRDYKQSDAESNQFHANNQNVSRYLLDLFPYPYSLEESNYWTSVGHREAPGIHKAIDLNGECVGSIGITPGKDEYQYSWDCLLYTSDAADE